MTLIKREFTPESGTVDTYAINNFIWQTIYVQTELYDNDTKIIST